MSEQKFPVRVDLVGEKAIIQGSDYSQKFCFRYTDGALRDTSGNTAMMRIRSSVGGPTLVDFHSYQGRILLGIRGEPGNQYNLAISVEAAVTQAITWWGTGVYQLFFKDAFGHYTCILHGVVEMEANITPPVF
jgi:hypothetical protein